jgi:tetratricopeptide (TPR) repeat protein
MNAQEHPWINRKLANQIHKNIMDVPEGLTVIFIEAQAGLGKTYLMRDIGTRFDSPTGYESKRLQSLVWSGILDVYDPDTNNARGIEIRLISAFTNRELDFEHYHEAREQYELWFKTGIRGTGLEEQRRKVEAAFAEDLGTYARTTYPVIVFDTIERLEIASSPVPSLEAELYADTASVVGWLVYQITRMPRGAVIFLGRPSKRFYQLLSDRIEHENHKVENGHPDARSSKIDLQHRFLDDLDSDEIKEFFAKRIGQFPALKTWLGEETRAQLEKVIGGKPLLLDLALQTLLESDDPDALAVLLDRPAGLEEIKRNLVSAYMNQVKPERATLLTYLAMARNGLSEGLLRSLEPDRAGVLMEELTRMADLPFIKTRRLSMPVPGQLERQDQPVYFLHDAMYEICDAVMLTPMQVISDAPKFVSYYDRVHQEFNNLVVVDADAADTKRRLLSDALVESLVYRMRADPKDGYQWYYKQADLAIREASTSLDMRLADVVKLFITSADPVDPLGLGSKIDQARVKKELPTLFMDFRIDSATFWMRRAMLRGKTDLARRIGEAALPVVESLCKENQEHYSLAASDFYLWLGQVKMYGYDIGEAQKDYSLAEALNPLRLTKIAVASPDFVTWRASMVQGRIANNQAYTHFLYQGRYTLALEELIQAIRLFRIGNIDEELANSSDNLGRVYALLGYELEAIEWILNGLDLRQKSSMIYREALTHVTLAQVYQRFGRFEDARRMAEDALIRFSRVGIERGLGLGLLGRGQVYRSMSEAGMERGELGKDALKYSDLAERDLRDALHIFANQVHEPIREVQVRNELGCCFRSRHWILKLTQGSLSEIELAYNQARQYLRKAAELAREHNYQIEWLDSLQDQAVLFHRAGKHKDAQDLMSQISDAIDDSHKIQPGEGLRALKPEKRVDAYYKLMGQVELLQGAIVYQIARTEASSEKQMPKQAFLNTAEHYLLAVAYFTHFSSEGFTHRQTYSRILRRFKHCRPDWMREINREHLPAWQIYYGLPDALVDSLKRVFAILEI